MRRRRCRMISILEPFRKLLFFFDIFWYFRVIVVSHPAVGEVRPRDSRPRSTMWTAERLSFGRAATCIGGMPFEEAHRPRSRRFASADPSEARVSSAGSVAGRIRPLFGSDFRRFNDLEIGGIVGGASVAKASTGGASRGRRERMFGPNPFVFFRPRRAAASEKLFLHRLF